MDIYRPIISPSIYQRTSLAETLHDLNDPKIIVTDDAVINMVVKYFFAYLYPESIGERVEFKDIEQIFERGEKYCIASRKESGDKTKNFTNITVPERDFYATFQGASYGLSMLGDIAPSAAIVKDIITRKIDPAPFEGKYVGLDLGTGTGILLLAQSIQAMRNDFKSIHNIGVELDESTVLHTKNMAKRLGIGHIVQGDSTEESLYHTLNITTPITFISNENIPTTGVVMDGKHDPFHQNNKVIYQSPFSAKLLEHTQTFPKAIAMTLSIPPVIKEEFIAGPANKFFIENLFKFEDTLKSTDGFTYEDGWTILNNIYTNGIALDGKIVPMHEVGNHLIENSKVNKVPGRRHRRSDKTLRAKEDL